MSVQSTRPALNWTFGIEIRLLLFLHLLIVALNWTFGIEMWGSGRGPGAPPTLNWTFGIEIWAIGGRSQLCHASELDLWN